MFWDLTGGIGIEWERPENPMAQSNPNIKRFSVPFFDGVNSNVSLQLAKSNECVHAENVRAGSKVGIVATREGATLLGSGITSTADYGLFTFPVSTGSNKKLYRVSKVSNVIGIYYLSTLDVWTALTGGGTGLTAGTFKTAIANGQCFIVDGTNANRVIASDGTTVADSTSAASDIYNTPVGSSISYYRGQLYLGYGTTILKSSPLLGIAALVNGDPASPYTTLDLTDTGFVLSVASANTYDIYRGGSKVAVFTVTSVTQESVTGTIAFEAGFTTVLSADEFWLSGTYTTTKKFRWAKNGYDGGTSVKEYDTMKLTSKDGSDITMNETIGDLLLFANKTSMASWDTYTLKHFNVDVGCVSSRGYIKTPFGLYFLHYSGIYSTDGSTPKLLSRKVQRFIDGATKAGKEAAVMFKKGQSIFCYIGDVSLTNDDGSTEKTLSSVTLEYSIVNDCWWVHSGITILDACSWDYTTTDRCIIATNDTNPLVLEYLSGDTDNGTEIPWRVDYEFPYLTGKLEKFANPIQYILNVVRGTGIKCFLKTDGNQQFYQVEDEATKGCSILNLTARDNQRGEPIRCRRLTVSLRNSSKYRNAIGESALLYIPTAEEESHVS